MITDCTAIILAGGESRRMGQDKASMLLGERTLLQNVAASLQPLFAEVVVSVREHRSDIGLPQVCDDPEYRGPLGGLLAGLESVTTRWVFLTACDMPFISPAVIHYLEPQRTGCQAVVPRVHGHLQPLAAFYEKSCVDEIRALLQDPSARHSLCAALERFHTRQIIEIELRQVDPQLHSFFDLDTPQDLILAIKQKEGDSWNI